MIPHGRQISSRRFPPPLLAIVSALLTAGAFPKLDMGLLAWMALVPLLLVLQGAAPRRAARLGFIHGVVFFSLLVYWIPSVITRYGGLSSLLGLSVGVLLVGTLALFHAGFASLHAWLNQTLGRGALLVAPAGWVVMEWLRLWPLGGFPWGYLGYTQHNFLAVLQLASLGGVHGLSFLLMAENAALAGLLLSSHWDSGRIIALGLALVLPLAAYWAGTGLFRTVAAQRGGDLKVAAIQGNVIQEEKWLPARREAILARHLDLTQEAVEGGARFILWPESSTLDRIETTPGLRLRLQKVANQYGANLVVGSVHQLDSGAFTNAAFLLVPDAGLVDRYDKIRLVPFGEMVPFSSVLFFIKPLVEAVGSFVPGREPRPLGLHLPTSDSAPVLPPVGVIICYELAYPGLVAAEVRHGATFLANITNDAWFGSSSAPWQHFAMAAVRAVETRRWLLRAANTGVSGLISPRGEVMSQTPLFQSALVEGTIRPRHDLTPAVRWPWAVPAACVMLLAVALVCDGWVRRREFSRLAHS